MTTLFMETTQIAADKTISEITSLLVKNQASQILTEYEDGQISSVCFRIQVNGMPMPFRLPCRWQCIQSILAKSSRKYRQAWSKEAQQQILKTYEEQARRVAWRQILRWIEAQLALVQTGMVKTEEVFMPYIQTESGQTLFEKLEESKYLMLTNQPE